VVLLFILLLILFLILIFNLNLVSSSLPCLPRARVAPAPGETGPTTGWQVRVLSRPAKGAVKAETVPVIVGNRVVVVRVGFAQGLGPTAPPPGTNHDDRAAWQAPWCPTRPARFWSADSTAS